MSSTPLSTRPRRRLVVLGLVCGIAALASYAIWPTATARDALDAASQSLREGRAADAEEAARGCFDDSATEVEAILLASQAALVQQAPERALQYLQRVAQQIAPEALPAHLMRARLLRDRLLRISDAEQAYRSVLEIEPTHLAANEELARLLATCGRRGEAIPHILRVLQADDNDLLVLLARESGLIHEPDLLQRCREAAPDDPLPPFGLAQYAIANGDTSDAIALLRESLEIDPRFVPAWGVLGEQLVNVYDPAELSKWAAEVPSAAESFAETWRARGQFAEQTDQTQEAIRCYWESLRRAPESRQATFRLAQLLTRTGDTETADRLEARLMQLDELVAAQDRALFSGQQAGIDELLELVRCYRVAGRLWEAFAWTRVALEVDPDNPQVQQLWTGLNEQVANLSLTLTAPQRNPARHFDFSSYPLPRVSRDVEPSTVPKEKGPVAIEFRSEGSDVGFDFMFRNGATDPPSLRMFEFTGGGIGVIDADLDGYPDVFCTQGGDSPEPESAAEAGDQLFRNLAGARFANVSESARFDDRQFGQGAAVGDFDGDGFADLYVANIGPNLLWRNNGDGTFEPLDVAREVPGAWTTSCLMADLDGDMLPDLYDVNYLTGDDVFEKTCRNPDGSKAMCMPFDFDGAVDRLLLNDGAGGVVDVTSTAFSSPPDGKGLGVLAWDENDDGRLAVLVANDTTPNALLTRRSDTSQFALENNGLATGIALNSEGKAEGCMGIALGDVNDDGRLDVHITNFLAESNTLYMADAEGEYFTDQTRAVGLREPSWNVLGFGTQFLDADLDGRLVLFVANGHLQDLRRFGRPYRMPAQLFAIRSGRAEQLPAGRLGPYFEDDWLGRAAARIDWNRDGREDLLVGHLEDPSVVLTNVSPQPGNALSLRLVCTQSPRDGTGASVRIRVGDKWQIRQITAGDGYQASNEKRIVFGVGAAEEVDELVVAWPAGTQQRFAGLPTKQRLLVVEGRASVLVEP